MDKINESLDKDVVNNVLAPLRSAWECKSYSKVIARLFSEWKLLKALHGEIPETEKRRLDEK